MRTLLVGLVLVGTAWAGPTDVREAICQHPDDEGSSHTLTICSGNLPVAGHPFRRYDSNRTMTCELCMQAHSDSPDGCRIVDMPCLNMKVVPVEESDSPTPEPAPEPEKPEPKGSRTVPRIELKRTGPSGAASLIQNSGGKK